MASAAGAQPDVPHVTVIPADPATLAALSSRPPVQVWRAVDASLAAVGYVSATDCWMRWPGHVTFQFHPDRDEVVAHVERPSARDGVDDLWRRSVLPHLLVARGLEALHASAVLTTGGVVACCGPSGIGKSTLARALAGRGFTQVADDAVVLRVGGHDAPIDVLPLPFSRRLRDDAARHFAAVPAAVPAPSPAESAPLRLRAVLLLERAEAHASPVIRCRRRAGAEALTAVMTHAHAFDPGDEARRRRMGEALLTLVGRVPIADLSFAPGLERLDVVADDLAGLLEGDAL